VRDARSCTHACERSCICTRAQVHRPGGAVAAEPSCSVARRRST
jgi:hypothetical protein